MEEINNQQQDIQQPEIVADPQTKLQENFENKRKKLPMNIIEFCVGAILLVFCLNYLASHPAEKSSIVTGIQVMVQKVQVLFSQVSSGKGKLLERKFEMMRAFDELIFMGEEGECMSENDLRKLYSYRDNLEAMEVQVFERQQFTYMNLLRGYNQTVVQECDQYQIDLGLDKLQVDESTSE